MSVFRRVTNLKELSTSNPFLFLLAFLLLFPMAL